MDYSDFLRVLPYLQYFFLHELSKYVYATYSVLTCTMRNMLQLKNYLILVVEGVQI